MRKYNMFSNIDECSNIFLKIVNCSREINQNISVINQFNEVLTLFKDQKNDSNEIKDAAHDLLLALRQFNNNINSFFEIGDYEDIISHVKKYKKDIDSIFADNYRNISQHIYNLGGKINSFDINYNTGYLNTIITQDQVFDLFVSGKKNKILGVFEPTNHWIEDIFSIINKIIYLCNKIIINYNKVKIEQTTYNFNENEMNIFIKENRKDFNLILENGILYAEIILLFGNVFRILGDTGLGMNFEKQYNKMESEISFFEELTNDIDFRKYQEDAREFNMQQGNYETDPETGEYIWINRDTGERSDENDQRAEMILTEEGKRIENEVSSEVYTY